MNNSALLDLLRALPARNVALARTGYSQVTRFYGLGDGRAGCGGRAGLDFHRRHQRVVRTDEHVFTHHGLELVGAIVVAGDGAGADIGARTDFGIPQVCLLYTSPSPRDS